MASISGFINTDQRSIEIRSVKGLDDSLTYKTDQWVVVADASFYKEYDFKTAIPEYILAAWKKWGTGCAANLYGDFAFIILNQETGEFYCARDPIGIRPLFYSQRDGKFFFASQLRHLFTELNNPVIREDYLLNSLLTIKESKSDTPFRDIFRLMPGHYLHLKNGKIDIVQYWKLNANFKICLNTQEEYINLLREKLVNAVYMRCSDTGHIGTELSGGLDSSAVTGIAARIKDSVCKLTAYSNVFPENTTAEFKDEREFISLVEDFAELEDNKIDRHNYSIASLLSQALVIQAAYIQQNFSIFNKDLYEKAGNNGVEILLSGFGGDELVSARTGIPWNEYIQNGEWTVLMNELFHKGVTGKSILKTGLITAKYIKSIFRKPGYTNGVINPELLDKRFASLPLNREFAKRNRLRERMGENFRKIRKLTLAERQIDQIMLDHLPQRLEYCYTAAAQYNLEYRYPLLDVDLIETALAFPPWLKNHHGVNRFMFREAIKGFVPEEIRLRNDKSGSTIPQTYYSLVTERDEILGLIRDASRSPFLNEIFDFSRFPGWYEKLVKRDPKEMNYLMPSAFYTYLMILLYYKDTWE